jgi:hypothetical protein
MPEQVVLTNVVTEDWAAAAAVRLLLVETQIQMDKAALERLHL